MHVTAYDLSLFVFDSDVCVVFNPESRAFCRVSPETAQQLLRDFSNVAGGQEERKIRITADQLKRPGRYASFFKALRVGMRIRSRPRMRAASIPAFAGFSRNIIIYPAFGCNLRCRYCWNAQGTYGRSVRLMDKTTAVQTGRWIAAGLAATRHADKSDLRLDFFGGEPLLAEDAFRIIVEMSHAAALRARCGFFALLQTNGLLLSRETIIFCKQHGVNISISLDGPAAAHNAMRVDTAQTGSHARVVAAIRNVLRLYPEGLQTRPTLVPPYDVFAAYACFKKLGIPETAVSIARAMPHAFTGRGSTKYDQSLSWSMRRGDWHRFLRSYLKRLKSGRRVVYIQTVIEALDGIINRADTIKFQPCRLGRNGSVVLPDGSIAPCYAFAFDPDMVVGNTTQGGARVAKLRAVMAQVGDLPVWSFARCRTCFARYLCGGPCYAWNKAESGSIRRFSRNSCEIFRETAVSNVFLAALWQKEDPLFISKLKANKAKGSQELDLHALFNEHYRGRKRVMQGEGRTL